jgi:hypothetical protein
LLVASNEHPLNNRRTRSHIPVATATAAVITTGNTTVAVTTVAVTTASHYQSISVSVRPYTQRHVLLLPRTE